MASTETICINTGRKKVYYSAVKVSTEYVDCAGIITHAEGSIPNGHITEYAASKSTHIVRSDGVYDGEIRFYNNEGVCLVSENYSQGKLHGLRKSYHPDGVQHTEEEYDRGVHSGLSREWYHSGNLKLVDSYEKGVFINRKEYEDVTGIAPHHQAENSAPAPQQPAQSPKPETAEHKNAVAHMVTMSTPFTTSTHTSATEDKPATAPAAAKQPEMTPPGEGDVVRKVMDNLRIYLQNDSEVAREILTRAGAVSELVGQIPDGIVREYYRNGQLKLEELYKDGKLNGLRKKFDEMGRLWAEENYLNGKMEGQVKVHNYFKDKVFEEEASFKDNKLNGIRRTFYPNSKVSVEENYLDGRLNGIRKSFYENGHVNTEETYTDDRLNGARKRYYDNGQLWNEEIYLDGRLDGERKDYYPTGQLRLEETYKEGKMHGGRKFFYDNGHPMYEETYIDGKLQQRKEYKTKQG